MTREAVEWLRANASKPFFLYFAPTIPHVALQVPALGLLEEAERPAFDRLRDQARYEALVRHIGPSH